MKARTGHISNMSIIIREDEELPLIVKLLKKALHDDNLTESEILIAHELYEDLKEVKWH